MLHIVTFKWHQEGARRSYESRHVNAWLDMVSQHGPEGTRILCVTDDSSGIRCETHPLWEHCSRMKNPCGGNLPSCYRRLRLFDPECQKELGIEPGDRVVSMDLDAVVVGELSPLYDREESFVGWAMRGKSPQNPRVYQGSMWMFRAGEHADVWSRLDPAVSPILARRAGFYGSDQAWLNYVLGPDQAGWSSADGVYYHARGRLISGLYDRDQGSVKLSQNARIVFFPGRVKPWDAGLHRSFPWIRNHYPTLREAA